MKRKAHYTVRIADQICEQIALGKTLRHALKVVGYLAPTEITIWRWLDAHPDFREKYDRARKYQADSHADTMLEMAEQVIKDPKLASAYKVSSDILKWQAEVRNRGKYGRKAEEKSTKTMNPEKLRQEIKRLENELGVQEKLKQEKVVKLPVAADKF